MKNRFFALFLVLAMLTASTPVLAYHTGSLLPQKNTYQTAFPDAKSTWCASYVQTVYEVGLMNGTSATTFSPQGYLSRAQIVAITARLHELLNGGDGQFPASTGNWYDPYYRYLSALVADNEELDSALSWVVDDPTQPCDRYDFVWLLHAVLPTSALTAINHISALPDVGGVDDGQILSFYNAGILTGTNEYGAFEGGSTLNRGQAAAMLARIVDATQRVHFTPTPYLYAKILLGLAPDTPVLTVDGYTVNAEFYTQALGYAISAYEEENRYAYYDKYMSYYSDYLSNDDYYDFAEYLLDIWGINVNAEATIQWNIPDEAGLTPAQKVQNDAMDNVVQMVETLLHQSEYPLTQAQQNQLPKDVEAVLAAPSYCGYTEAFVRQLLTLQALEENMIKKYAPSGDWGNYLADNGYFYGRCLAIPYSDEEGSGYYSQTEALSIINEALENAVRYQSDSNYFNYLIWKYGDSDSVSSSLIQVDILSNAAQAALKNQAIDSVSSVIQGSDTYYLFYKDDPSQDETALFSIGSFASSAKVAQWRQDAIVSTTPAYQTVDLVDVVARFDSLFA